MPFAARESVCVCVCVRRGTACRPNLQRVDRVQLGRRPEQVAIVKRRRAALAGRVPQVEMCIKQPLRVHVCE
jgi:hypothetical protein